MKMFLLWAAGLVAVVLVGLCNLSYQESACSDMAELIGAPYQWGMGTGCMVKRDGEWHRVRTAAEEQGTRRRHIVIVEDP